MLNKIAYKIWKVFSPLKYCCSLILEQITLSWLGFLDSIEESPQ